MVLEITEMPVPVPIEDEESMRRRAAANYVQSGHFQEAMNVLRFSWSEKWRMVLSWHAMANMGMGNNVTCSGSDTVQASPSGTWIICSTSMLKLQRMEGGGGWYQQRQDPFGGMPTAGAATCVMPAAGPWPVSCAGRAACFCC